MGTNLTLNLQVPLLWISQIPILLNIAKRIRLVQKIIFIGFFKTGKTRMHKPLNKARGFVEIVTAKARPGEKKNKYGMNKWAVAS